MLRTPNPPSFLGGEQRRGRREKTEAGGGRRRSHLAGVSAGARLGSASVPLLWHGGRDEILR